MPIRGEGKKSSDFLSRKRKGQGAGKGEERDRKKSEGDLISYHLSLHGSMFLSSMAIMFRDCSEDQAILAGNAYAGRILPVLKQCHRHL